MLAGMAMIAVVVMTVTAATGAAIFCMAMIVMMVMPMVRGMTVLMRVMAPATGADVRMAVG